MKQKKDKLIPKYLSVSSKPTSIEKFVDNYEIIQRNISNHTLKVFCSLISWPKPQ